MKNARYLSKLVLLVGALLIFVAFTASVSAKTKPAVLITPDFGSAPAIVSQGTHGQFYDLRWEGWGNSKAVAHGRLQYSDEPLPDFDAAATMIASHLTNCGPWRVYTKWTAVIEPDASGRTFPDQSVENRGCPRIYCDEVVAYYPDVEGGSGVEVWATSMRCKDAKRVVVQCIKKRRVPGWGRARLVDGEMVLTRGAKKISMEGTAGGAPHCASV